MFVNSNLEDLLRYLTNPWLALLVTGGLVFILVLIFRFLRFLFRELVILRFKNELRQDFSSATVRYAWKNFIPPVATRGPEEPVIFIPWMVKNILIKKNFEYSHYFLLGDSGIGKTTAMIRLYAAYRYSLNSRDFAVRLFSLADPSATFILKGLKNKEKTVLLLDGLEDNLMASYNYKAGLDKILTDTAGFAKVIISVQKGFLPPEVEGDFTRESVKYTGEECYQLFGRIELQPLAPKDSARFVSRHLSGLSGEDKYRLREEMIIHAELYSRPGWARWANALARSEQPAAYPYEIYKIAAHYLLGNIPGEEGQKEKIFAFSSDLAANIWKGADENRRWAMPLPEAEKLAGELGINLKDIEGTFLEMFPKGYVRFIHKGFLGLFVAWKAFYEEWLPGETHFSALPEAAEFFHQMCWQKALVKDHSLEGYARLVNSHERRELTSLSFREIREISRIYLKGDRLSDVRFLRGLPALKGLYLDDGVPLRANIVRQLPHESVILYLRQNGSFAGIYDMWQGNLKSFSLHTRFSPLMSVIPDIPEKAISARKYILEVFSTRLRQLPNEACRPHPLPEGDLGETIDHYRLHLGVGEMELFNLVEIYVMEDLSRNIVFSNTYLPTLLSEQAADITNRLVQVYGEDDRNTAAFGPDDLAQIEDGYWMGRRWFWKNSDNYPYPVHLYMETPGKIKLEVFGILPEPESDREIRTTRESSDQREFLK
ncbi:MAG: hypothetical protein SF052_09575 [Bacteroidia bacterium]|nr:hypothetical protein [Bacteroidia bacterium]